MRKRLLQLLVLGVLLAQVTVVTSFLQCQECGSGTSDKDCPSGCETCVCCSMPRVDILVPMDVCALNPIGMVVAASPVSRQTAYPQDIFHVPRLALS